VLQNIKEIKLTCFSSLYAQHEDQKVISEGTAHCKDKDRITGCENCF